MSDQNHQEERLDPTTCSATTPDQSTDAQQVGLQLSFLLQQIEEAPDRRLSRTEANRKLRAEVKRDLGLHADLANHLRKELAAEGFIKVEKEKRNTIFILTEKGRDHLATLPRYEERSGARGRIEPVPEEIRGYQKAYLLLQLFRAPGMSMVSKQANRFDKLGRDTLLLNAAAANRLRRAMADQGYIEIEQKGRNDTLTLTRDGIAILGTMHHHPESEVKLNGSELNALLEAARDSARQFLPELPESQIAPEPSAREQIYNEIVELLQTSYHLEGKAPVHEIRRRIEARHGAQMASHDVLDLILRQLEDEEQIRLLPLEDGTTMPEEELEQSLTGETVLFYVALMPEPAHISG